MFNLYDSNVQICRLFRLFDNVDLHGPAWMTAFSANVVKLTRLQDLGYVDCIEVIISDVKLTTIKFLLIH